MTTGAMNDADRRKDLIDHGHGRRMWDDDFT